MSENWKTFQEMAAIWACYLEICRHNCQQGQIKKLKEVILGSWLRDEKHDKNWLISVATFKTKFNFEKVYVCKIKSRHQINEIN